MTRLLLLTVILLADEITFTVRTPPAPPKPAVAAQPAAQAAADPEPKPADPAGYYVVVYTARWCGPCQQLKARELEAAEGGKFKLKDSGVPVTVVDVDKEPQWNKARWATDTAKNQKVLIPGVSTLPTVQVVRRSDRIPVWQGIGYHTARQITARIPQPPKQNPESPTPPPPESG